MITEQARSDVYLNGQQAGQELDKLAKNAEKLKKEMVAMRKANDKAGFDKKQKELRGVNKEMKNLQKQAFDVNKVLKNMKSTSLNDLYKAQRTLNREMRKLPQNSREYKRMEKDAKKLSDQINKVKNNTKGIHSPLSKMKNLLMGIGVVAGLKSLITNMVRVRAEFEKYEAMLEVALGSQDLAARSMRELATFASKTPFQLNNLTDSFVKLINQGFKPGQKEMTKMGDLSASMGKDFGQLTEAIIDAQTGEFERLKEFGIRASKEGDKVTFMFREQATEVDFTADAIRQYILELGEMEGIQGSMANISGTLGGRLSNLKDSWDNLMNSLGAKSSGVMINVINWAIDLTNGLALAAKSIRQIKQEVLDTNISNQLQIELLQTEKLAEDFMKIYNDSDKAMERARARTEESLKAGIQAAMQKLEEATTEGARENYQFQIDNLTGLLQAYQNHYVEVELLEKKRADAYKVQKEKEAEERKKIEDKERKEQIKAAEGMQKEVYDAELALIHKRYLDGSITQEQYEQEQYALKMANLEALILIRQQYNLDYADLEEELFNLQVSYMEKTKQERERYNEAERKAQEKADAEEQQRRDRDFEKAKRDLQRKYDAATQFSTDIVSAMVGSWDERKRAEIEYNKAVDELNQEYKDGRIGIEEYEASMADLNRERKKEEIELEKKRGKEVLLVILDYLHKYALAKIAEITIGSLASPESIATAGIAGVAKAAIMTALVEAAFQAVKSKISQNYEGRYVVTGAQDNRTYFATGSGDATTGVYSSPTLVAERGTEMIIDNPTLSNISMNRPDIIRDIQSLRVPQYAEGRIPASASSASSIPESQEMKQMVNLLRSIESALLSGKVAAVVGDYQVRELRNRMDKINSIEKSVSK